MIKTQPIKRSPALVQFSRDHHFALLLVWKIRQGFRFGVEPQPIGNYITFFFENYLKSHFKQEEELLFKELDEHDDLRLNAEQDHKAIYELYDKIKRQPGLLLLKEFADKLEQHIRFEERLLFAHLQNSLHESQLNFILQKIEPIHSPQKEDDWQDVFWMKR